MFSELKKYTTKPKLYTPSTNKFFLFIFVNSLLMYQSINAYTGLCK